jgi:hypothetical protein
MNDVIEYYHKGSSRGIAACHSAMVPPVDSLISIRKDVWRVVSVTYALDSADGPYPPNMRANVELEREG